MSLVPLVHIMSFIYKLTFGQLLSLSTTASSLCSQFALNKTGIAFIAVPDILIHFILLMWYWKARPRGSYRHLPVFWYAMAALSDVSANYLIFSAFFFAPVTQISLLEDAIIPISFAFDLFWFKRVGKRRHSVGALLCTASLIFYSLMTGGLTANDKETWKVALGIVLPLLSVVCYYTSNALQIYLIEHHDRDTFMYFLGLFGSLFSLLLSIPLVRTEVSVLMSSWQAFVFVLLVVFALLFFYISVPDFLASVTPTFFNMSLMTKNFYILLVSEMFLDIPLPWYGWVAFACIMMSLCIFNWDGGGKVEEECTDQKKLPIEI